MTQEERDRRRLSVLLTLPGTRTPAEQAWIEELQSRLCKNPAV